MTTAAQVDDELGFSFTLRQVFDEAIRIFVNGRSDPGRVPYDTGALAEGIVSGDIFGLKGEVISTTTNDGFDYPQFLNEKSVDHQGWWEEAVADDQEGWDEALQIAARRLGFN